MAVEVAACQEFTEEAGYQIQLLQLLTARFYKGNNMSQQPIFLVSGTPGAGKSSVTTALMQRFEFGLHIPVDDLREWVVSGLADPVPTWTEETARQFHLARQSALQTARLYAEAGFAVAIDDVLFENQYRAEYVKGFSGYQVYKVLLVPSLEQALTRNANRTNKTYDTAGLVEIIKEIHQALLTQDLDADDWLVIDSTSLTITETVDVILKHIN